MSEKMPDAFYKKKNYDNFNMTLDECRMVFDAIDNLVIIDADGFIKYLSPDMYFMVEAYNKRPVPENVVGKHIKDIHPLTKITNAIDTGKPENNCFYFSSNVTNVARIKPLYKDGHLAGAIDYDIFTNGPEIQDFLNKLTEYAKRGIINFDTTFRSMYNASKKATNIKYSINDFIGDSYAARNIKAQIANLGESDSTVLITKGMPEIFGIPYCINLLPFYFSSLLLPLIEFRSRGKECV